MNSHFYRLAYSYVQNQKDALDIVQDSIQKAMLSKTLKDDKTIKSWFYKIVVNTSLYNAKTASALSATQ